MRAGVGPWNSNWMSYFRATTDEAFAEWSIGGQRTRDDFVLTPWQPGAVGSSPAGLTLALSGASTSGNPVTMSTDGPCQLQGANLTLLSPETCVVTAASLGNGGSLTPSTSAYTVTITK